MIPGNDDAIRSCQLIIGTIGGAVETGAGAWRVQEEKRIAEEMARRKKDEEERRKREEEEKAASPPRRPRRKLPLRPRLPRPGVHAARQQRRRRRRLRPASPRLRRQRAAPAKAEPAPATEKARLLSRGAEAKKPRQPAGCAEESSQR